MPSKHSVHHYTTTTTHLNWFCKETMSMFSFRPNNPHVTTEIKVYHFSVFYFETAWFGLNGTFSKSEKWRNILWILALYNVLGMGIPKMSQYIGNQWTLDDVIAVVNTWHSFHAVPKFWVCRWAPSPYISSSHRSHAHNNYTWDI